MKHFLNAPRFMFYIKELFQSLFESCDVGVFGSLNYVNLSFVVKLNSAENFECRFAFAAAQCNNVVAHSINKIEM